MKLIFATECRFVRHSDGKVYSTDGGFTKKMWGRYLQSFCRVIVVARVLNDDTAEINERYLSSCEHIEFIDLPYYIGPKQFLKVRSKIYSILSDVLTADSAYICRVPGTIGSAVTDILRKRKIPYGVEVVGDPWDVYAPGAIKHSLRPLMRLYSLWKLKKIVLNSSSALYVTCEFLQKRYSVRSNIPTISASNVQINDSDIAENAKVLYKKQVYNLISVGSLAQMYKAPDVLIKSMQILKKSGIMCHLTWLGDGIYKKDMITLAEQLDVSNEISFIGSVTTSEVRTYLLNSDVFLLVSRTEGLPRAMVEAMSCGLPCIGSNVGGIPELIDKEAIVKANDDVKLANLIKKFIFDIDFANKQAVRNLEESKKYRESVLSARRSDFYNIIKNFSKQ